MPFGSVQRQLATAGAARLQVIAQRRLMMRAASALAARGAEALVTGDSLGQVSSQTLRNLSVVRGCGALPVPRPLVAWDKSEIVHEAQDIGTYEIANLPAEDCSPCSPARWPRRGRLLDQVVRPERRLDVEMTGPSCCARPNWCDRASISRECSPLHKRITLAIWSSDASRE